jgi:hypothetical protein
MTDSLNPANAFEPTLQTSMPLLISIEHGLFARGWVKLPDMVLANPAKLPPGLKGIISLDMITGIP